MITTITFLLYFAILMLIAIVAFYRTKNHADYILGGRTLNGVLTAMGVGASDMSGWLMMALPGSVYLIGLSKIWMPLGLIIGAWLNWQFVGKRLRVYTEVASNSLTIPAYFSNRFHDTSGILRTITGLVILIFFTFYSSSSFVAGAKLFSSTFDISYQHALWICSLLIVIYTSIGGFLAVNWVDLFQGTLMLFALLILPAVAYFNLDTNLFDTVKEVNEHAVTLFKDISILGVISLLAWGLGYFGQPHILVRFMAARGKADIQLGKRVCMTWMILSLAGAVATGFIGTAFFVDNPLQIHDAENVFLKLAQLLFNPWIAGILLAAVLSAIISTVAAQLLASSSAFAEDFYRTVLRKKASQQELIWAGRMAVVVVALIALWLARDPESSVLPLVSYAWAGLGAAFGPVVLCSLYWRNMTRNSALFGMIFGASTIFIWDIFAKLYPHNYWAGLYEIIPAFIMGFVGIWLGKFIGQPVTENIVNTFNDMELQLAKK